MSPCTDVTIELDAFNIGKTNIVKSKALTFGGKALNVAIGVRRLGESCHATGVMYNDNGYMFENVLDKEGVPFTFVWNKGRARENYKFIDSRSMLTEVNDVGENVSPEKLEEVLATVRMLSARSSVTVLSGSLPRGVDPSYYAQLVRAVDKNSLKIVDTSGQRMFAALREGVDLVKPNIDELEDTIGKSIESKEDMLAGCRELIEQGAKRVLLSLGKKGAVITDGKESYFCKSLNVAVNSTVGAGDGMVAAAAVKLQQGAPLPAILRAGVAAGTATVMTVGQTSFTKEKYNELFSTLQVKQI
ncbi:MAG: 1-phosphofructokinase family hexose kinase [Clostridia bacterium]|nr:1-phosphofructokinase family hexose kinase [Clostridia bacterium]MBQ8876446.1 1-phosphofructokinase family hexose kinase [Clostridia bacterium]